MRKSEREETGRYGETGAGNLICGKKRNTVRKRFRTAAAGILCAVVLSAALGGCAMGKAPGASDFGEQKYPEFLTVDVYDAQSNFQGIQGGWFGEIIKDRFNMELNIIAPNVAGGGDTLYETRAAAENLGDLVIARFSAGGLADMVSAGLVLDMSVYMEGQEHLAAYMDAILMTNGSLAGREGIWGIPSEVTTQGAVDLLNIYALNSGIYLRWDLYQELGYPKMETFEDLLPVMQEMQEIAGVSDSGKPVYAFSLFKDWDGIMMKACEDIPASYGWATDSFVLQKADDSEEPVDLLAEDSPYIRNLEFYFEANRRGLLDPESPTQNYETLYEKYEDGAVLYAPWPWLGQNAYNTTLHAQEGKGFETACIEDLTIREWGCYVSGNPEAGIMVGSRAQDPQRMVDFIDWLYSPEGIRLQWFAMTQEMYEMGEDGPVLTDLGREAMIDGDVLMPEEYGGGSYWEGKPRLNYKTVALSETDPETGYPYNCRAWSSYADTVSSAVNRDWQEHMGAQNALEFWKQTGRVCVSPGTAYTMPPDSSDIAVMRTQVGNVIKEYSWKAVYAQSEEEFQSLIEEMRTTARRIGYDEVVAVDLENAEALRQARQEVRMQP